MSDQGKANYEGYHASVPGSKPVPFDELPHLERLHWDAGACSVEAWLADAPVDEDMPGNEPKPAKVIVVTDDTGRDRRYAADEWQAEEAVDVLRDGQVIVTYPQGTWRRATVEGAELAGVRPTAIRLQAALRKIAMADDCTADEIIRGIARAELERSGWDKEDL